MIRTVGGPFCGWPNASVSALLTILAATVALRAWQVGEPLIGVDQQFYQLVGERMTGGLLPYRDVFDIKPPGIFALHYLMAELLPKWPQAVEWLALLCAFATSAIIHRIARLRVSGAAAIAAAVLYLAYLPLFDGFGAQTPVIYNLFVAAAAWSCLALSARGMADTRAAILACAPMLLMGLAIATKYMAMFEGAWFGLILLWRSREDGVGSGDLALRALCWAAVAFVPLAGALLFYGTKGAAGAFVDANFLAVLRTGPATNVLKRLATTTALLLPLLVLAGLARRRLTDHHREAGKDAALLVGWVALAVGGYLLFGTYLRHYALPLLVPLTVLAALGIERLGARRLGRATVAALVFVAITAGVVRFRDEATEHGSAAQLTTLTRVTSPLVAHRCLYIFDGPPALYRTTGACFATRFVFPQHLENVRFSAYPPRSQIDEIKRILAQLPGAIVLGDAPLSQTSHSARTTLVAGLLARYRLAATVRVGEARYQVWALR